MSGVSVATGVSALDVLNPSTATAVVGAAGLNLVLPSGDATGVADRVAIQAAHDALPSNGGEIQLISGIYYLDSEVTFTKPVKLHGAGGGLMGNAGTATSLAPTTINCLSATANGFNVSESGCTFRDFALINTSGTTPTAGAGILDTSNNTTTIDAITVLGFWNNLDLGGVYYSVTNCHLYDAVNYYAYLHSPGAAYNDHGDMVFANNVFSGWKKAYSSVAQIRWESGGGLKCTGNKFNSGGQPGNASAGVAAYCIQILVEDGISTSSFVITGNSISGWPSNTCNVYVGQLGPLNTGTIKNFVITGNEITLGKQALIISEGSTGSTEYIANALIADNTFTYFSANPIRIGNSLKTAIGMNLFASNTAGPMILIDSTGSGARAVTVAKQSYGSLDSIDLITDNRSYQNNSFADAGGITHEYERGIYISSNGVWQTQWVLTFPNGVAGQFEFDIAGQNANSGHNSANNKGVAIRQHRSFDVSTAGVVTLATIGTDIAAGVGAVNVAVQYVLTANTITVQVQTTDVTQLALYAKSRLRVDGRVKTIHIGA